MTPKSDLSLGKQVCFALYAASRAVTQAYRAVLDELGLTYPQYLVLLVLWERGTTTVKDLGAALELDSGTLSPLLKRLEHNGFVTRTRCADDERSVRVELTDAGEALSERALDIPQRLAQATGMSRADLETLRSTLNLLAERMSANRLTRDVLRPE